MILFSYWELNPGCLAENQTGIMSRYGKLNLFKATFIRHHPLVILLCGHQDINPVHTVHCTYLTFWNCPVIGVKKLHTAPLTTSMLSGFRV